MIMYINEQKVDYIEKSRPIFTFKIILINTNIK